MKKYSPGNESLMMSREDVRAFDAWAINETGVPGAVLMENAGRSCAELIMEKLRDAARPRVCVFCGSGNNGGDGYVAARHLRNSGFNVRVVLCGPREKVKGDAAINLDILERLGQSIKLLDVNRPNAAEQVKAFGEGFDMVVDALFGTGLKGRLSDEYIRVIESINSLDCPIVAVDIPSGLDCDTGQPLPAAIRASFTVTFVAVKKGFAAACAADYTGEIHIASIGVEPADARRMGPA
jgi:NAD(P)H-hydrate epimerase